MSMKVRKDEYRLLTNGYEGYKHGVSGMGSGGWWEMGIGNMKAWMGIDVLIESATSSEYQMIPKGYCHK